MPMLWLYKGLFRGLKVRGNNDRGKDVVPFVEVKVVLRTAKSNCNVKNSFLKIF